VTSFRHRNDRAFFAGAHASLACAQCHTPPDAPDAIVSAAPARTPAATPVRVGFASTPTACASCHKDVHLGQLAASCETCHSVAAPDFALVGFSHDRTRYPLTGAHERVACSGCHRTQTRQFPRGRGTATHFTGLGTTCVSCHTDVHRGEVSTSCESCHSTRTFTVRDYTHRNARALRSFFAGRHNTAGCRDCHKTSGAPPAPAALMSFRTTTTCVDCHTDVHRGALGPRCETCHRP
jgi:predicted CXXCH cytochrome family protein